MTEIVKSGIAGLDAVLGDGIPEGSTTLLYGPPGAGIELFAKQFCSETAPGETVVYFATQERDEEILRTFQKYGWKGDIRLVNIGTEYYEKVLAKQLEISKVRQEGIRLQDVLNHRTASAKATMNFLTLMTYEISKVEPPFRVVVDSLDFFLTVYPPQSVLSALRTIVAHTHHSNSTTLLTMHKDVHEKRIQSGIEEIVDLIFEMERLREGNTFVNNLLIKKFRNHPERTCIKSYQVGPSGITVTS